MFVPLHAMELDGRGRQQEGDNGGRGPVFELQCIALPVKCQWVAVPGPGTTGIGICISICMGMGVGGIRSAEEVVWYLVCVL